MTELKQEVNMNIDEFINKTQEIKKETHRREKTLKKIKHKYKKLQKKKSKLDKRKHRRAEDEALVEATAQYEQ